MERTFKNYKQTVKIDSKVLDRIIDVYERLAKENPEATMTAKCGLTFKDEIEGDDSLIVTIDKCPGIYDSLHTEVWRPFFDAMEKTGDLSLTKDWYENVQMTVEEAYETITYELKGFALSGCVDPNGKGDNMEIHFRAAHIFATRKFKE